MDHIVGKYKKEARISLENCGETATIPRNLRNRWQVNSYSNVRNTEREIVEVTEFCKDEEKQ
jgi:hypothetical protein